MSRERGNYERATFQETESRRQSSVLNAQVIEPVQIQSTATTIYTVPTGVDFWVVHLWAANVTGAGTAYTLYFVPSGGSAGTANTVVYQRPLGAKSSEVISVAINQRLSEGMLIQALCTTNDDVNIGGWGYDQTGEP